MNSPKFELHVLGTESQSGSDPLADLRPPRPRPVQIHADDGWKQVAIDGLTGGLIEVARGSAFAAIKVVPRRATWGLAVVPIAEGVLVNGLAALSIVILSLKDVIVAGPGCHIAVTERVGSHVGAPLPELVAHQRKCPICSLPFTTDTRVITCPCGMAYHFEVAESHPSLAAEDRLNCRAKVGKCLGCRRELIEGEYLLWDPMG